MVDEEAAADFESEQPKVALFGSVFGGGGFLGAHSFWRKQNERCQQA